MPTLARTEEFGSGALWDRQVSWERLLFSGRWSLGALWLICNCSMVRCLHGSDGVARKVQSTVGGDSYCQRDSKGTEKV